ncbi:hypothetical protein GGI07_004054 [Coemansia sp. Benny D115]|nr:hypothetical protein GGI07_004054 [Coemansia sp. Benny D115]
MEEEHVLTYEGFVRQFAEKTCTDSREMISMELIMTDDEIGSESRKLGLMYGVCATFLASFLGNKALGLKPKINAFSAVEEVDALQSTGGWPYGAVASKKSPTDEYSRVSNSISTVPPQAAKSNAVAVATAATAAAAGEEGARRVCRTIERTWEQGEWLHNRIEASFRLQALPPFPERPSSKKCNDPLYVERQRARMERWLNRVGSREDLCQSASVEHFISSKMSPKDVGESAKQSFSSMFMGFFGGPTEHGFRVYTPIGEINDYDEDEEERRREYITQMEECAGELGGIVRNMHVQEEALGKSVVKAAMAIGKAYRAEAVDSSEVVSDDEGRERLRVSLALLLSSAESHYWSTKELGLWKEFNFVDPMSEFCTMVNGVKDVMNHSTQMLVLYEKALQRHQGLVSKANSLRVQYPSDTPSVKYANEQEAQGEREMELAHQEYTDACEMASKELVRFERERADAMCKALENTAKLELESARMRCQELKALCRRIRTAQMVRDPPRARTAIGPMLWHAAGAHHPSMMTPATSSMSFPRSASSETTLFSLSSSGEQQRRHQSPLSAQPTLRAAHHRYSNSSSGALSARSAGGRGLGVMSSIGRAHTMDNADFARNHSVFSEGDEYEDEVENGAGSGSSRWGGYGFSDSPASASSSKPAWSRAPQPSTSASTSTSHHKRRWNGRISALPYQGYLPEADTEPRLLVDQNRLAEMAAEAEMEAELVRSGMLAARQKSAVISGGGGPHGLPLLPAFRTASSPVSGATLSPGQSQSPNSPGSPRQHHLRQTSSFSGLSSIPQPVSPSEYLQYSRQHLHSSLASPTAGAYSAGSVAAHPGHHRIQRLPRRDKGKGRAFAA